MRGTGYILLSNLGVSAGTEKEGSVYGASGHRVFAGGTAGNQRRRNDLALSRYHRRYRECRDASDGGKIRS